MTFRHVIVSLAAVSGLAACSSGDTIVSLNVSATDAVPVVDELRVTITQGSREHVARFAPPQDKPTGENAPPPSIKNTFFERIKLPDDWEEADATVEVEGTDENGAPLADETTVKIRPEGVVVAYVQFDIAAAGTGGTGGAGGAGGESAAGAGGVSAGAGAGGDPSGAGATGEAGAPSAAGAGGAAGAGTSAGAGGV